MVASEKKVDSRQERARRALIEFFESNRERVFYSRQLEVLFERSWFHWITNRAIHQLIEEGTVLSEPHTLSSGVPIFVLRHKSYRYPRRDTTRLVGLVNEYSQQDVAEEVGWQGEFLVLEGFARNQFVMIGRNASAYQGNVWTATNHDLDFVFERDGVAYGVEVKNQLGYMDHNELQLKARLCLKLGLRPVFAARMLPKEWINEVNVHGGFALIMRYQMFPKARRELVDRMRDELQLPVDTPTALYDGTMQRFLNWHEKNL